VIITYWWIDPEKDRVLKEAMKNNTALPMEPEESHYKD
jgi:hypothetical protein